MTTFIIFYDKIDEQFVLFRGRIGLCEHCGVETMIYLKLTEPIGPCVVENCQTCLIENSFIGVERVSIVD